MPIMLRFLETTIVSRTTVPDLQLPVAILDLRKCMDGPVWLEVTVQYQELKYMLPLDPPRRVSIKSECHLHYVFRENSLAPTEKKV